MYNIPTQSYSDRNFFSSTSASLLNLISLSNSRILYFVGGFSVLVSHSLSTSLKHVYGCSPFRPMCWEANGSMGRWMLTICQCGATVLHRVECKRSRCVSTRRLSLAKGSVTAKFTGAGANGEAYIPTIPGGPKGFCGTSLIIGPFMFYKWPSK